MGDPALDSRPPSAFSYLGEAGADRALFLRTPPPYAISLLLKIRDGFQADTFGKIGLTGSSQNWERLACDDEAAMREYLKRAEQEESL